MNMNQQAVARNPFQTDAKKVLCCCSAGLLRSPTAANVLHQEYGYNTRACGVDTAYALIPITQTLVYWADEIVCMDNSQATVIQRLLAKHGYEKEVIPLGIDDSYIWNQPNLRDMIKLAYENNSPEELLKEIKEGSE